MCARAHVRAVDVLSSFLFGAHFTHTARPVVNANLKPPSHQCIHVHDASYPVSDRLTAHYY